MKLWAIKQGVTLGIHEWETGTGTAHRKHYNINLDIGREVQLQLTVEDVRQLVQACDEALSYILGEEERQAAAPPPISASARERYLASKAAKESPLYQTGNGSPVSGVIICQSCGATRGIETGEVFPPCPRERAAVTWWFSELPAGRYALEGEASSDE